MFKFRLLLFFVGAIQLFQLTPSTVSQSLLYGPQTYPGSSSYSFGYAPVGSDINYQSMFPSYGSYGSYPTRPGSGNYGSEYSESCGIMKVIEILDQIFCGHIDKRRYSSTVYPTTEAVISQIEYSKEINCIPNVLNHLTAAEHELKTLQEVLLGPYKDSALTKSDSGVVIIDDAAQTTGTQATKTEATSSRDGMQAKLTDMKTKAETVKKNSQIFLKQKHATAQAETSSSSKTHSKTKDKSIQENVEIEVEVKQRSGADDNLDGFEDTASAKRSIKTRLASSLEARRKLRNVEFSDYTCALLPIVHCEEDLFDELLFNILLRLWSALDFLWEALVETWFFINELDCSTWPDRCALIEASIMYGSIGNEFYLLVEVADYIDRILTIQELETPTDEVTVRAGGGNEAYIPAPQYPLPPQPPQLTYTGPPMKKPLPAYVPSSPPYSSKPPAYPYPFSAYMTYSQPQQAPPPPPPAYSPQPYQPQPYQQPLYRPGRTAPSVSIPSVLLIG